MMGPSGMLISFVTPFSNCNVRYENALAEHQCLDASRSPETWRRRVVSFWLLGFRVSGCACLRWVYNEPGQHELFPGTLTQAWMQKGVRLYDYGLGDKVLGFKVFGFRVWDQGFRL